MPWNPNCPIPHQLSKASPALTVIGSTMHMVHLGDESNKIWHSIFDTDQDEWLPNDPIPHQLSKATPALSENLMIHLGDEHSNFWASIWDGQNWSDNVIVQDETGAYFR
jgi:hypothetical protein